MRNIILVLLILHAASAFSILSYYSNATVLPDGSLNVLEEITFGLEEKYNEGFRSIRPQDAPTTGHIAVDSVRVNGQDAGHYTQVYGDNAEIVWTTTYLGENVVELNYTLKDKVELFDDYARVCFEHFGAGWSAPAEVFESRMTMPEGSRGKTVHFEIYSTKGGEAKVDNLTVVARLENVPPGNYVGGCYLFARDSVDSGKVMNGSAYEILRDERESYGSRQVLGPETPLPFELCCAPIAILSGIFAALAFVKSSGLKRLPESMFPPDDEEPVVVAAIVNGTYNEKDILASTILGLINRGKMDIVELERKGERSAEVKRERTVLLRKSSEGLKPHEQAVMDMIFFEGKEVELDELAKGFDSIGSMDAAKAHPISKALEGFRSETRSILTAKKAWSLAHRSEGRIGNLIAGSFGAIFLFVFFGCGAIEAALFHFETANQAVAWLILGSFAISALSIAYLAYSYATAPPPKEFMERYTAWDAFRRGLKASRIKEHPPSSAVIWGDILVYATALGLADKVKRHLSELDSITLRRVEEMEEMRERSYLFYASAIGVGNLAKYGNRSGISRSSGGFSSRSSGGWSSGGGGGFSGGSSGGGGFR